MGKPVRPSSPESEGNRRESQGWDGVAIDLVTGFVGVDRGVLGERPVIDFPHTQYQLGSPGKTRVIR